ncbi:MAG: NAD-dependent epimerase/dehydratase family protein, partial [Gaiellaceae bacterium]
MVAPSRRLLVTGGCGYLGRELVRRAPAAGWDVRATWWQNEPRDEAEWVRADVRDLDQMRSAVAGVDAVIHTAYVQGGPEWEVNVEGSAAVAEA